MRLANPVAPRIGERRAISEHGCGAVRYRYSNRATVRDPVGAEIVLTEKSRRHDCPVEDDGRLPRSESAPGERSSPVQVAKAIHFPSAREPQRTAACDSTGGLSREGPSSSRIRFACLNRKAADSMISGPQFLSQTATTEQARASLKPWLAPAASRLQACCQLLQPPAQARDGEW